MLAKILDFQTRCDASDTWEIAADHQGHPKITRAAAEAREAYGKSVIEAEVTGGDAGGEDGPGKRNREIQGEECHGLDGHHSRCSRAPVI